MLAGEGVLDDPTAPLLSGVLFLVAAPTLWLWAPLDLAPGVTVGAVGADQLPALVRRSVPGWPDGPADGADWWARYLTLALTWTLGFLLFLAAVATLTG